MDLRPYVENVRRYTAELKRRNAEATARARADLPKLVEVLRSASGLKRAYLYGSLAKGTFHPKSDIDIAVEGLNSTERDDLHDKLQALTAFPVDLRDLNGSPRFRGLIEFYGELLHANPRRD